MKPMRVTMTSRNPTYQDLVARAIESAQTATSHQTHVDRAQIHAKVAEVYARLAQIASEREYQGL